MKILVANLKPDNVVESGPLHFPIGLAILVKALKNSGYAVDTYDSYIHPIEGFYQVVTKMRPGMIIMSGYLGDYFYRFIKKVSKQLKELSPSSALLLGGPAASTIPELFVENTDVDYVCVEEGEELVVEMAKALQKGEPITDVQSVYYRNQRGECCFTGMRDRLDKLHMWPEYDAFPIKAYIDCLQEMGRCWEISASRGCPYHCAFCKHPFQAKTTFYSIGSVVKHMQYVYDTYGVNRINFVDDNFFYNQKRITSFLRVLGEQGYDFEWRCIGRADSITAEVVAVMKQKGLFGLGFGIESASQKMLDVYQKQIDIRGARENLLRIREIINFHVSFIIGGPGEDWETIEETKRFIEDLELNNSRVHILVLFPGTSLYEDAMQQGFIVDENAYCDDLGPVYDYPYVNVSDLSDKELLEAKDLLTATARQYGPYT